VDEPIDLEAARNRRLPRIRFVELPECECGEEDPEMEHSNMFLVQLFETNGMPVLGRVGLQFGIEDVPAVSLTGKQCRALSEALGQAAEHLEAECAQK
jgi:hypothetical protein